MSTIESARLTLVTMSSAVMEAVLAGDLATASSLLGLTIPPEWLPAGRLMQRRLAQLRQDPTLEPWLLRAMGLRSERRMIGHIGFHTRPGAEYLRDLAPGGVELGYSVFEPHRRQGFATEACAALMDWAHREHGVTRFVVSISPGNLPSIRIAQHFRFRKIGAHIDEEDGPEDIYLREIATP